MRHPLILIACALMWEKAARKHGRTGGSGRIAFLLAATLAIPPAVAAPKVWIFNGDPGDDEHHEFHQKNLRDLRQAFTGFYGLPGENVRVFYGPREAGYDGVCTRETLLAELGEAAAATREAESVWIIFQGHANSVPGGALFNLPGPDVSPREMAEALKDADPETPLVIFATTAASDAFLRPLSAPGRIVVTANSTGDPENETDFPIALAAVLGTRGTDANRDGFVSVTEIFKACHAKIVEMAEQGGHMIREHAALDGDGDGKATRRPADADAEPASRVGLHIGGRSNPNATGFD